jgi:hypothetical protein
MKGLFHLIYTYVFVYSPGTLNPLYPFPPSLNYYFSLPKTHYIYMKTFTCMYVYISTPRPIKVILELYHLYGFLIYANCKIGIKTTM